MLQKNAQQNEAQFNEMKFNFEKCLLDNNQLNQMLQRATSEHEKQVGKLKSQVSSIISYAVLKSHLIALMLI